MGLYDDIQSAVKEALNTDLADATADLTIVVETVGSYNPVTGKQTSTTETYIMRCTLITTKLGEDLDEPTTTDYVNIMVLDSEMTIPTLKIGYQALLKGINYEIVGLATDPTVSTHTIKLRKL